jgi:hypothetical protein
MRIVVSYARKDESHAGLIVQGIGLLGCEVWFDQELGGGVEWWGTILAQIRRCDLFLAVISRSALASVACGREREYAEALGKPILPVRIELLPEEILPPDLARRQLVDFTTTDVLAAFRLAGSVSPSPRPRPSPPSSPTNPRRRCRTCPT